MAPNSQTSKTPLMHQVLQSPARHNYTQLNRRYEVHVYDHTDYRHKAHPDLQSIAFQDGELFIDGVQIRSPHLGPNFIRFANQSENLYISGILDFSRDGRSYTGRIYRGTSAATAIQYDVVGAVPPTVYESQVSTTSETPPTGQSFPTWKPTSLSNSGTTWVDGLRVTLGYTDPAKDGGLPTPIYLLNGVDMTQFIIPEVDKETNNLMLAMDLSAADLAPYLEPAPSGLGADCPVVCKLEFSWNGSTFSGVLQKAVEDGQGVYKVDTGQYGWKGTAQPQSHLAAARPSGLALAPVATDDPGLSTSELWTLTPNPDLLSNNQLTLLIENMKWAMGNTKTTEHWLTDLVGEKAPELNDARQQVIKSGEGIQFYTERFAPIYFGSSFNKISGPGAPSTKLDETQTINLEFYMRAGLGAHPAYTAQSQGVALDAFVMTLPRLGLYIQDQAANPEHNWAQRLFDEMTSPLQMNIVMNTIIAGNGMDVANRHATVLMALQPSGDLARNYHALVTARALQLPIEHLDLTDKAKVESWLTDTIQAFIDALVHEKLPPDKTDPHTRATLLAQALDLQQAVQAAGSVAQLAAEIATIVVGAGGQGFWEKLSNAQTLLGKAGYRIAQSLYFIAIVGGISQAIAAFQNWNKLSPEERANAIISTIAIGATIVEKIPEIATTIPQIGVALKNKLNSCMADPEVLTETTALLGREGAAGGAEDMSKLVNPTTNEMGVEGTAWTKVFSNTVGRVCKAIGAGAALAFAALSMYTFIEDILHGREIKTSVLDGIMMAANIAGACFSVASIFVTSAIPVIGAAIAAIIGIISSLIALFWPPAPPVSPVEQYMRDFMVPAVSGSKRWVLDAPSGWQPGNPIPPKNAYNPASQVAVA